MAGVFRSLFDTRATGEHDQVGQGDFLAIGLRAIELVLDAFEFGQHIGQLLWLVGLPGLLRCQAQTPAVGTAALVGATEAGSRRPSCRYKLRDRQAGRQHLAFQARHVTVIDQRMIDGRDRVLPQQFFVRHFRAEVA
ncbi:hypothetical protein D3C75_639860 [compost metagenome]